MAKDDARDAGPIGGAQQAAVSRYSRRVRLFKIALPIISAGLIGAIFVSGRGEHDVTALLTPAEIARLAAGMKLENPRFVGQTEAGEPFVLRAATAEPDGVVADRVLLARPAGEIEIADGRRLTGRSDRGFMLRERERLVLEGGVRLETSEGQRFESERLILRMADRMARSPGPVRASGPSGTLEAGSMRLTRGEDAAAGTRILFEGGVRVVFIPTEARGPSEDAAASGAATAEAGGRTE